MKTIKLLVAIGGVLLVSAQAFAGNNTPTTFGPAVVCASDPMSKVKAVQKLNEILKKEQEKAYNTLKISEPIFQTEDNSNDTYTVCVSVN